MSNLRTRLENELMGGWDYDVLDSFYPPLEGTQKMESPSMAEKEPSSASETRSRLSAPRPKSLALAEVAANAVHAAWEAGYAAGVSTGRLSSLDFAVRVQEAPTGTISKLTYDPGDKPF